MDAYPAAGVRIPSDVTCAVQGLNAKCVESHPGVGTKGGVVLRFLTAHTGLLREPYSLIDGFKVPPYSR